MSTRKTAQSGSSLKESGKRLSAIERENETLRAKVAQLESAKSKLESQLLQTRESRIKIRLDRKSRTAGDTSVRMIIPDSHGCYIDQAAASALIEDIRTLQPSSIIMLGDHLDCGGFLAEHHTWGYVAETSYTFEDDCNATNQFLDAIQAAAPGATIEYLEGNHERRIEKWIVTETVRTGSRDAAMLNRMFSVESVLHLEKRGVGLFRQGRYYDRCSIPGTIRRDGCYFTHGQYTGLHAAHAHLKKYNANVWYGHTHRFDAKTGRNVKDGPIGAWNPGCLCHLQPYWMHQNLTDWIHGFGVQLVRKRMGHLNLQIPIIDGVSYLSPLLDRAAA